MNYWIYKKCKQILRSKKNIKRQDNCRNEFKKCLWRSKINIWRWDKPKLMLLKNYFWRFKKMKCKLCRKNWISIWQRTCWWGSKSIIPYYRNIRMLKKRLNLIMDIKKINSKKRISFLLPQSDKSLRSDNFLFTR